MKSKQKQTKASKGGQQAKLRESMENSKSIQSKQKRRNVSKTMQKLAGVRKSKQNQTKASKVQRKEKQAKAQQLKQKQANPRKASKS